ncbi:MAG: phytanoyl-CoA dioxygenase family protein [Candidatus Binatia bacterium]
MHTLREYGSSKSALIRAIRSQPHVYSAVCKARLGYARYVAARVERALFNKEKLLFAMNSLEAKHCEELRRQGFTVLHDFFAPELIDDILEKAEWLFRRLQLDIHEAYSVQNKQRKSLEGLSYVKLAESEKMISLADPLLSIPQCVDIAYHESILKIVTNFLGYVVTWFKVMVIRDFPLDRPKESSNFHRDNDETDSIQAFVYLVDIDDRHGPLVYVPGTHRYDVTSCRPRLSRDLGIDADDGRISDREMEKYYPSNSWVALRVKRGTVAIIHGNGFHKGPSWPTYSDGKNQARTAIRLDFHGPRLSAGMRRKQNKITTKDYYRLSRLQRFFTEESAVVGT